MKKILALTICAALALSVFSTGFTLKDNSAKKPAYDHAVIVNNKKSAPDYTKDTLSANGLKLIAGLDKMAESEEYISLFTASDNISEIISEIGEGDYSAPKAVYKAEVPADEVMKLFYTESLNLSEDIKASVAKRYFASIPTQITATSGAESLAAMTLLTSGSPIIDDSVKENQLYIFIYDGISAMVTYTPYDNGAVDVSASFVINKDIPNIKTADEMEKWFEEQFGGMSLDFSEIK